MKTQTDPIQIERGVNGWYIHRPKGLLGSTEFIPPDFHVFETFDHLVKWLKEYYEKKPETK
jgi:hypothetical protein